MVCTSLAPSILFPVFNPPYPQGTVLQPIKSLGGHTKKRSSAYPKVRTVLIPLIGTELGAA